MEDAIEHPVPALVYPLANGLRIEGYG